MLPAINIGNKMATKKVKELAARNEKTMAKCPTFKVWAKRFLKNKTRADDYSKAFDYVQKGEDDGEAVAGLRPVNED